MEDRTRYTQAVERNLAKRMEKIGPDPTGYFDLGVWFDAVQESFVLVKMDVSFEDRKLPDEEELDKARTEQAVIEAGAEYDMVDRPIRFDVVGITRMSDDSALIRHHMGVNTR